MRVPFTTLDEKGFPVPVLAQVDRKQFEICVPFKYRQDDDAEWIIVPKNEDFLSTDLASVPGVLLWLVPRYGVHTLAALLHDQLVDDPETVDRNGADRIFRNALGELEVPWIRRWMMWAAVSLATMTQSLIGKVRIIIWGSGVLLAAAMFWQHAFAALTDLKPWSSLWLFGAGMGSDLAIVAVLAFLFVPRIGLGLLAGATAMFIFVPTVAVIATTLVYLVVEKLARLGLSAYNRVVSGSFQVDPVANVPVVMALTDPVAAAADIRRGCPELRDG
jgi:hypothetical protein